MRRLVVGAIVLGLGVSGVLGWQTLARDREYRRLVADGDRALAADQTFAAIEAFSGAITLKKDSMLAHLRRGEAYRRRGELQAALSDLRAAARLDPMAPRPLETLGDVQYGLQRYGRAAERYAECVQLDDRSPRVLYKLALSHYRDGRAALAVEPLRKALRLQPRFAEANYLLGLALQETGHLVDAQAAFADAVRIQPALIFAREQLAELSGAAGATRQEVAQIEALAALDPGKPQRQVALALAYARAGRSDLAVLTLGHAAEGSSEPAAIYTALGRLWLEAAETRHDRVALSKALEALQGAVTAPGATSETLTLLGRALLLAEDAPLAERVLTQATTTFPVELDGFARLAEAAERTGHLVVARDALVAYERLAGDTDTPARRALRARRLAALCVRTRDLRGAAAWFTRAAELAPDAAALADAAGAQARAGDAASARASVAAGLALEPRHAALLRLQEQFK